MDYKVGPMEPVKQTKLTIKFPGDASQWNLENIDLPVEVRRLDSALVGRTLATGSLNVGPGTYVARAVAPGGEFTGSVEVPPGKAEASVLMRFSDQSSLHGVDAALEGTTARGQQSLYSYDLLTGHLLQGEPLVAGPLIERQGNGTMRAGATAGSAVLRIQSPDSPSCMIASLPQSIAAHVSWLDASDARGPNVVFQLDHPQAQLLLLYLSRNAIADAQLAAQSATLTATQLLRGKKWDPLAGALGAYVLLRQNDDEARVTEELHERSHQLWKYNSPLPDAWCIWAECQARAGEHQQAFETLLELNYRGLPFFSDGLRIAGIRLAKYLQPKALPQLDASARERAAVLLSRLRWLGMHAVPGQPILKMVGFDPADTEQYQDFWRSTGQ